MEKKRFALDDETWARFNYSLLKQTSWLTRRVETWSYVGDAQWCRSFSFDLNADQIDKIWKEAVKGDPASKAPSGQKDEADSKASDDEDDNFPQWDSLCIPMFDIDKRQQFSDFDLRDESGRSLHLMMRRASALITLSALIGALKIEHKNDASFLNSRI